jgi:hypothetical protein
VGSCRGPPAQQNNLGGNFVVVVAVFLEKNLPDQMEETVAMVVTLYFVPIKL